MYKWQEIQKEHKEKKYKVIGKILTFILVVDVALVIDLMLLGLL